MKLLVKQDAPCECGDHSASSVHGYTEHQHPYKRCRHLNIRREEAVLGVLPSLEELVEESFYCDTCNVELRPV